ncbi:DUF47 domain-containing protein [Kineococcus sp. SYSU DK002]|uniref:DUF47 domain-containing protein n=1 Tax=Kineococcus sp. SYSU DK002 TaxID=3383123 RepID=UPI003D7C50AF
MRFRLTPRDDPFFELIAGIGGLVVEASTVLAQAIGNDPARRAAAVAAMEVLEHRGDELARQVADRVVSSFVTPLDREDLHQLALDLDDCVDLMQSVVDQLALFDLGPLPEEAGAIVQVLVRQAELTAEAVPRLRALPELVDYWIEIHRLENQADELHRRVLAELFTGERDVFEVLKHKEIADRLEAAANGFERVAHTVERLAIKES